MLAATRESSIAELDRLLNDLRARYPDVHVVLGGPIAGELSSTRSAVRGVERVDQVVPTVQGLLGVPERALQLSQLAWL